MESAADRTRRQLDEFSAHVDRRVEIYKARERLVQRIADDLADRDQQQRTASGHHTDAIADQRATSEHYTDRARAADNDRRD